MLAFSTQIQIVILTSQGYSTCFSCEYTGRTLNVFAYRVHAHARGLINAAYKVHGGGKEWTALALGDPQRPQSFYPIDTIVEIHSGDAIVGACTYQNHENRTIYTGRTHQDEMCSVYIMYFAEFGEDTMPFCWENKFSQLESAIPAEGLRKPVSFTNNTKQHSHN